MNLAQSRKFIGGLIVLLGCAVLAGVGWVAFNRPDAKLGQVASSSIRAVEMNGVRVRVELAISSQEQQRGLSGRESLGADQGMLFLFPSTRPRSFWMKQMNFPIDIIWINRRQVVDLTENAPLPVEGEIPPTYRSKAPVDTVLEAKAGFSKAHNLKPGTEIRYFCAIRPGIDESLVAC